MVSNYLEMLSKLEARLAKAEIRFKARLKEKDDQWEAVVNEILEGKPKLDRPYKEKINTILWRSGIKSRHEKVSQILALFDEEEIRKQERIETGEYLEHCHLSIYETHRLISIHDIERLKSGQALKQGTEGG